MKKFSKIIIAFTFALFSAKSYSQKVEIVPMAGYIFQSTYYGYDGRIVFSDGFVFGGMLNFKPNEDVEVGLNILNQNTDANLVYSSALLGKDQTVAAGIINYQLSLVRNFVSDKMPKVVPFAGLDIGAVQFYGKEENTSNSVKMSIGFKGGIKISIKEGLNFRIQPQLEMPIQGLGVGIGVGTGGASVGATTYASIVQFGILGGLGYTIKGKSKN